MPVRTSRAEWGWLAGATLSGGVIGPVLLMTGLVALPAASASLLLNMEGVLTALLAWVVFKENVDRRVALGMAFIVAGAVALSWPGDVPLAPGWPALAVLAACLAWAIDNNLTRKVSRTGAYFSVAPFFGALLAVALLGERLEPALLVAGTLMLLGGWLNLAERHGHVHSHEPIAHTHEHEHEDEHHAHEHGALGTGRGAHTHHHVHQPLTHVHGHYPDAHHEHRH